MKISVTRRPWTAVAVAGMALLAVAATEAPPEKPLIAELVWARAAPEAQLVSQRMEVGFLVSSLTMLGTKYLGRVPLLDLDAPIQDALRKAGPGHPVRVPWHGDKDQVVVAQILPDIPAILGATEYTQVPGRSKPAFNPANNDLLNYDVPVDANDLAAVCSAKKNLVDYELAAGRAAVAKNPHGRTLDELISSYGRLGAALAFTSDMDGAIKAFDVLYQYEKAQPPSDDRTHKMGMITEAMGLLNLRKGELDNCVMHHNAQMCIFPLSAAAVHKMNEGSRKAVLFFTEHMEYNPRDIEVLWLLNIAAMTLGEQDSLPAKYHMNPAAFQSTEDIGRFWDVAAEAGVAKNDNAGGSISDDFDNDGWIDLVESSRDPCEPVHFYRNRGDGTFEDRTEAAGLAGQLGGLNIIQTDYNNDGNMDIFVMRGGWETPERNSLLRNNGDGTFTDVTAAAGLMGLPQRTHSAVWADFDNDGYLDVFVAHEFSFSQLFRNRGDGTFEDVTESTGMRFRSLSKGANWGDIDNDGWPDLYVSNFGQRNLLFHNLKNGKFEEIGERLSVSEPYFSFATWFWDYDNDGWLDLMVQEDLPTAEAMPREYLGLPVVGETMKVYHNRGDGTFEDATKALGLDKEVPTMGCNFGDLDNDGYPDFYLATGAPSYAMLVPNRMFHNKGGKYFVDVTQSTGTGSLQKGHGVSFADLDNDGDEDVFENLGGAYLGDKYQDALFENPGHGNDWISIHLIGVKTNRAAIGARIRVVLDEGDHEGQRFHFVSSGSSFGSNPLLAHIGLGPKAHIKRVEIDWPTSHTHQVVDGVAANQWIEITEGKPGFKPAPHKRFTLGGDPKKKKTETTAAH